MIPRPRAPEGVAAWSLQEGDQLAGGQVVSSVHRDARRGQVTVIAGGRRATVDRLQRVAVAVRAAQMPMRPGWLLGLAVSGAHARWHARVRS